MNQFSLGDSYTVPAGRDSSGLYANILDMFDPHSFDIEADWDLSIAPDEYQDNSQEWLLGYVASTHGYEFSWVEQDEVGRSWIAHLADGPFDIFHEKAKRAFNDGFIQHQHDLTKKNLKKVA